jgi:hypothetical protein
MSNEASQTTTKPVWVDALEESLILAIGVFSLVTWILLVRPPG